jgi:Ice-binding-like
MKLRSVGWIALSLLLLPWLMSSAHAGSIILGTAGSFGVLAGSTVTNTGSSVVAGNVGVWPGAAITGFPPGISGGTLHAGDAVAQKAQGDLTTAYNAAASMTPTKVLTGQDLGGMTLTPGVYSFSSSAQLTGTLTLNDLGNPNAVFVFQIGSTLTTATGSAVVFTSSLTDKNVFLAGRQLRDAGNNHGV